MVGSGNFDPRTGKKWDTTHKTATPKVKKGVVQAAVEEDSESNNEDDKTVLPSYAQLLKANRFININVHGGANSEESVSFDRDEVSEFGIGCLRIDDASLPGTTSHDQGVTFSNAGKWVVQGRDRTNPVNNQHSPVKNEDTAAETRKAVPEPTSAGGTEGTVRTKNEGTIPTVKSKGTVPLDMGGEKPVLADLFTDRFTLDKRMCFLDSCATYHTFFVRDFLDRVYSGKTDMNGSCNTCTVTNTTRGWYGEFKVRLNKRGIYNLLSIPMLEDYGYIVSTHTKVDWVVTTPKSKNISSKGIQECARGVPYINLREHKEGISIIEIVRKKFWGATKREIEKAIQSCTVQMRIGHPPDEWESNGIVSYDTF